MPIPSLPSEKRDIGSIGEPAYRFIDWLEKAGQRYWQILPTTHPDGTSPYTAFSAFAGNPLLIDLNILKDEGLIKEIPTLDHYEPKIDYDSVEKLHMESLREAFKNATSDMIIEMLAFKESNNWIKDYALFMAYRDYNSNKPLWEMDIDLRMRKKETMLKYSIILSTEINFYIFIQYVFYKQWHKLKKYAHQHKVELIGDMPIYVSLNSADAWSHPELFKFDNDFNPTVVAGCPPDSYAKKGQLWGNPVYDWNYHRETSYQWWVARVKHELEMFDVLRIDHFRGFDRYWEIPSNEETAINGKWVDGPKMELFEAIKREIPNARIIAEDLGKIDDGVRDLLRETGYPGMKVMIFGLTEDNEHTPCNWPENCIGYTSTHDSAPIRVEIEELSEERQKILNISTDIEQAGMSVLRAVYASKAQTVIIPIADILWLGEEARINIPGKVLDTNWSWRASSEMLTPELAEKLNLLVKNFE